MNKYNIKQVEVARETGKSHYSDTYSNIDFGNLVRYSPLVLITLAVRQNKRAYGKDQ